MLILDQSQKITHSNEESFALIGKRPEQIMGLKLGQVLKPGVLQSFILKGYCFKAQPILINGKKYLCDFCPLETDGKSTGGILSVYRTEQHSGRSMEMPDLLSASPSDMDITQDSLIMVNTEGIITMINQPFADVLGIRAQEMIGKHVHSAYPNSNPSRLPVVMDTGKSEVAEPHLLNGRHAVVSRYPLIKDGEMVGALGKVLFQDVREVSLLANKFQAFITNPAAPSSPGRGGAGDFKYDCNSIIGHSKVMKDLKEKLLRIAQRPSNVLLTGESGTGKELFAHAIHAASKRRYGPFIRVNCAAIPEHLIEAELFGYSEGAFTGAKKGGQAGKFELAHNGTIFLDEISEMPTHMQAKLLRVLQEREITPLGSNNTKRIDIRVVAATNVNLQEMVKQGDFRTDLYYRLNIVTLVIPPLRERIGDIYFITKHLVDYFNSEFEMNIQGLNEEAWDALKAYDYPGNIRELRNAIESAFNIVMGQWITLEDLPPHIREAAATSPRPYQSTGLDLDAFAASLGHKSLQDVMEEVEKHLIEQSLEMVGGNKLNAASMLGISRPGLYKKLQKYQMH